MYQAFEIGEASRRHLLHVFPPKYSEVLCNHVTVKFPAKPGEPLPPVPHSCRVIGYADSGDGLEALVVEINGSIRREDGRIFHATLSLDRLQGKKPVHSNQLLGLGWKHVNVVPFEVSPRLLN